MLIFNFYQPYVLNIYRNGIICQTASPVSHHAISSLDYVYLVAHAIDGRSANEFFSYMLKQSFSNTQTPASSPNSTTEKTVSTSFNKKGLAKFWSVFYSDKLELILYASNI